MLFKGNGLLRNDFEAIGIDVIALPEISSTFLGRIFFLYKNIKKNKYDIVHLHLISAILIGRIISWLAGCRIIVSTEHNTSNFQTKYYIVTLVYRLTSVLNKKILAISNAVKNELIEKANINPQKIEVLYNGIELINFTPEFLDINLKDDLNLGNSYPIIGSVGRLDIRKGYIYLIKAISILKNKYAKITLILVGDGNERIALVSAAKRLKVEKNILFVGTQKKIQNYLSIFDFFVQPSVNEGLSISLIEAMAMKKKIVASKIGGIPEVVENNIEGILVPPANSQAIADAIIFLIDNPETADKFMMNARKKVEDKFNIDSFISRLENIYYQLLIGQKEKITSI